MAQPYCMHPEYTSVEMSRRGGDGKEEDEIGVIIGNLEW